MSENKKVFISYAREDIEKALNLYHDLKDAGLIPWIDDEDLLPGQNWKTIIQREIRESRYFIAVLSKASLDKRGFVQKELKMALDIRDEFPDDKVFLIPVRLDDCKPQDEKLQNLHWADMSVSYQKGFSKVLRAMGCKADTSSNHRQTESDNSRKIEIPKKIVNTLDMEFVYIPPGTFMMGSPPDEPGRYDNEILHKVTLTKGFYMQTTQITVGNWRSFASESGYRTEAETGDGAYYWTGSEWKKDKDKNWNNPGFGQTESCPVTCVSWNDTQAFIRWLNRKENSDKYRLPTEAEWEDACRAGTSTPFYFGKCLFADQANYDGNYPLEGCPKGEYRGETTPVGSFPPNAWGLYDMHGNVWEWCQDWYGNYPPGAVTDPVGTKEGSGRVLRGGSWYINARLCRSAYRNNNTPGNRNYSSGFRLVRFP